MRRCDFNPRTPVGCDRCLTAAYARATEFQSTHPSGVRPAPRTNPTRGRRYFNPRTPVGCDFDGSKPNAAHFIFQSTHPSGVRPLSVGFVPIEDRFQSTHPSGVRHPWPSGHSTWRYFNPRTPVGCDRGRLCLRRACCHFNPRTPVGCDWTGAKTNATRIYFNPRTPVGCDKLVVGSSVEPTISIHAPQWGATGRVEIDEVAVNHFNPRTPVGCDRPTRTRVICLSISIHAPQWGATNNRYQTGVHESISIHAPQWGATDGKEHGYLFCVFQSTHPSGVRPRRACRS